jgi:aminoglycoside phosphotransferase (APT) family kinase protein
MMRSDHALPRLAQALDTDFMRSRFAALLENPSICRVDRIRYKPGRSCTLAYRIDIALFTARMYPPAEAARRIAKSIARSDDPISVTPTLHWPDLGMLIWQFPRDRKLRHIAAITDVHSLRKRVLPAIVQARWGSDARIDELDVQLVHYVPEQGCTVRVRLDLTTARGARTECLYGKTYAPGAADATWRIWQRLHEAGVPIAPPIAHDSACDTIWSTSLTGQTLAAQLEHGAVTPETWDAVARAIAQLHRAPAAGFAQPASDATLGRLTAAIHTLTLALPHEAARLQSLAQLLAATRPVAGGRVPTHGDLHPKNILMAGSRAGLIDLDTVRLGDPLADLGSLCAALIARKQSLPSAVRALISAYRSHAAAPPLAVAWHTAYALATERAYRAVSRMKPGRIDTAGALIALSEQQLERRADAYRD